MAKPLLCLDFDGVIHSYKNGWKGADVVSDPPVMGALQFIETAQKHFIVAIFSSRSHQVGGKAAMVTWLQRHLIDLVGVNRAVNILADMVRPAISRKDNSTTPTKAN